MEKRKIFRPMPRVNIRFEDDLEIYLHKVVSSLRYGDEINLEIKEDPSSYVYAVKKSAFYNCMDDLKVIVSRDKKSIKMYMEI